ncbi:MAG: hypothetical protein ACSHX6_03380 [Akkermansiaceae bacterium]
MKSKLYRSIFITIVTSGWLTADVPIPDQGLQLSENPPMEVITRTPTPRPVATEDFEIRNGYVLIDSLDALRVAMQKDNQKIRMKPGVYRATKIAPAIDLPLKRKRGVGRNRKEGRQEHIFVCNGSHNYFDLRGVVIETPVSLMSKLSRKPHVADSWHINGTKNVFIGGYFENIIDAEYPDYGVTDNEFEINGDDNQFFDCTFVIKGSIPYGYTDFYGKGHIKSGRLNKHSFMSIDHANGTRIIRCKVFQQSFGHCIHLHTVDGVHIEGCALTGTLRPTNDIFKEVAGRAVEHDFKMTYRTTKPIPRDHYIPLTEDGIRSYDGVQNITVINTTVERMRGAVQLLCGGDVILKNVTVKEPGDFSYDVSVGDKGRVVLEDCKSDVAYNPVFNLMRGEQPKKASYEVTLLSPPKGAPVTPRSGLGIISGDTCKFILRDGTTTPLPEKVNVLNCGGPRRELVNSTIENYTTAKLILNENVSNCHIKSIGPVVDNGKNNKITIITSDN